MEILELSYEDKSTEKGVQIALGSADFDRFDSSVLGLGNISNQSSGEKKFDALAAIFDLEGFTSFYDQRDPNSVVPNYLDKFLHWLFEELKRKFKREQSGDKVLLWGYLPVYAKFMGDGVLFLWKLPKDDRHGGGLAIGNIVVLLHELSKSYKTEFLQQIKYEFANPPKTLRCSGAFGQVVSIGNNKDYVGACINVASRLQKIDGLSFAFAQNGCDPRECFKGVYENMYITKKMPLRGLDKEELILVAKAEFDALPLKRKKEFDKHSSGARPKRRTL